MTYEDVIRRAESLGSGLLSMGLSPGVHTMVGVYARNCPEWVITEQGAYSVGPTPTPWSSCRSTTASGPTRGPTSSHNVK